MLDDDCLSVRITMMEFSNETPVTLAEVPLHVPKRHGRKVHYSTVYRWVTKGARGRRLESLFVGGVRYTTVEAIKRFLKEQPRRPGSVSQVPNTDLSSAIDEALNDAGV